MYVEECLARERQRDHLRRAEQGRSAQQVAELRKLEKRQERAQRQLLRAWRRAERLRSILGAAG